MKKLPLLPFGSYALVGGLLIVLSGLIAFIVMKVSSSPEDIRACTEEAMICPGGSAVGRTGPNCSFAPCPPQAPPQAPGRLIPDEQDKRMCTQDVKKCPDGSYVSRTGPNCKFSPCSDKKNMHP